jgi:hypothetical protein
VLQQVEAQGAEFFAINIRSLAVHRLRRRYWPRPGKTACGLDASGGYLFSFTAFFSGFGPDEKMRPCRTCERLARRGLQLEMEDG